MKILCFGEVLFDVFGTESKIGGAPLNFAAHAVRAGAEAYLMSAVGQDELGDKALEITEGHNVKTDYISRSKKYGTGVCRVTLDGKGVPSYDLVYPTAYDDIAFTKDKIKESFAGLYFGTLALRGEANKKTLGELLGSTSFDEIFVDVNVRLPHCSKDSLLFAFENATTVKISDEELPFVMGEVFSSPSYEICGAMIKIAERFPNIKLILITCGEGGSVAYDARRGDFFDCPAVKAEVVSTVGAGDSFSATFMVNYMSGESIPECMKKASAVSAYVVSKTEAVPD